jgi:ATP-dependent RNA helicase RhlE
MSFSSLGLSPALLRALADNAYTVPTPIQAEAIPLVLAGRDVLGGAQTGTGKTAAFGLPLLQRLSEDGKPATGPRAARADAAADPRTRGAGVRKPASLRQISSV